MMTGMLIVFCVLVGYVAWFMFKTANEYNSSIEEKIRQARAEVEEKLNKLDK